MSSPKDLKSLLIEDQIFLCDEVRNQIIIQLSKTPGHFSSSLGVVELTVAIHSVFNTPDDKLIWDVGHQSYAHKILTGRKESFSTLRNYGGLSGFTKRSESIYDDFGTGHSSTSISAILGMAVASKLDGKLSRQHVAVIGDGALTAGMAFEALNNASSTEANVLIIVNDNQQSIDDSVGALEHHFESLKAGGEDNIFKNLGITYYGVVDGNNYEEVHEALEIQKELKGVRVLHCKTVKGKGYFAAENGDAATWHAPGKFDPITGEQIKSSAAFPKKYQDVFGEELVTIGELNKDVVAITPAMISGSSLHYFQERFPNRFFDVGIAEQHAVTFAAGLAANGKIPFCVIYSTFLQRAYDQIIHDVAIQNLPVVFCVDRAGIVGEDGTTHHGVFDISFLRSIPNLIIISPRNEQELINAMHWSVENAKQPIVIRYPRGRGVMNEIKKQEKVVLGKSEQLIKGENIAIVSVGKMAEEASKSIQLLNKEKVFPSHYDIRFIKPLDSELINKISVSYERLIVVEDGSVAGGVGSAILELLSTVNSSMKVHLLGIKDAFVEHGSVEDLYEEVGLNGKSIYQKVKTILLKE